MVAGGLSKVRLDGMREVLARHVEHSDVPGVVALVSRHGETHVEVLGYTTADGRERLRRDAIFRIASMTKPVTAVATMILVEECKVQLDEPVDRLVPELADRRVIGGIDRPLAESVPANRPVTVRDLLTFTMGLGIILEPPGTSPIGDALAELELGQGPPAPGRVPAPDEWIRRLGTLPLVHQPGERWMYNTGSDVLGVLVARAANQPFPEFLRERIFDPLGMHDTGFRVAPEKTDRFVTGYWTNFETGALEVHDEPVGGQWNASPAFPAGGSGLVSTADDFNVFAQMLLRGGAVGRDRVLSRPSVELMTSDQLTAAQKAHGAMVPGFFDGNGWGFGVAVVTRRTNLYDSVGAYGWTGGLGTSWSTDPAQDMTTILLTQRAFTSPVLPQLHRDFATAAYAAIDD